MKSLILAILILLTASCSRAPIPEERPTLKVWVSVSGKSMIPTYPEVTMIEVELGMNFDDLKELDDADYFAALPSVDES